MIKVFVYNRHYYVDGVPVEDCEFVESFCPIDFNCELQNERFR